MELVVSFCITVYNQSELVKKCIDNIVKYNGNDIEIVISDDGSTEDIKTLVDSYQDGRIKYYVNEKNLGHDRNILNVLSKAKGKYAFLLRTRDLIIPNRIPLLVKEAKTDSASYITGEAINQNGDLKIQYTKDCFHQGSEAIQKNYDMYIHPSGNMYRLRDIDFPELLEFMDKNKIPKDGFIVHNMIRLKMATLGDFKLINKPVWIYTDTESARDRAVNKSLKGMSVYDPSLLEKRYLYEVKWAKQILEKDNYKKVFYLLTRLYLDLITWGFKLSNSDKKSQYHYDYQKVNFSVSKQRKKFRVICESLYSPQLGETKKVYEKRINNLFFKNRTIDAVKFVVRKITYGTSLYNVIARFYKKNIKGL
jgi:glycosyltransferase involved in cell wall biosynthesis